MLAPKNIESYCLQTEDKISESLSKKKWHKPFLLFISVTIALLTFNLWTQSNFPQWSRFHLIQDKFWATYVLIFLSFVPLFIKKLRAQTVFLTVTVSASWLFPIYKLNSISFNAFLPIIYLLVCALILNVKNLNRWAQSALFLLLYLVTVFLITNNAIDSANGKILFYFSNTHLDLLLLYFIGAAFNNKSFPNQLHFNPLQLVAPAPLPESSQVLKDSGYEKQFTKGIIGIIIAQTIFIFLIYFLQLEVVANTRNPFVYYFAFIFTVIGAMKMASSLLWIYGIKTISATYFLLLAKSPIEIWQRGSVFIADFLFNKIYLPVWKRSRSTTLSATLVILAVLLHLFVFHEILVKTLLRLQFGNTLFGTFGVLEFLQWGLWLVVWLIWILAFSVFSNLTKSLHPKPAFQWFLVVLTHLGSAMIFPTVFYLASVIRF